MSPSTLELPDNYLSLLQDLKARVQTVRFRAQRAVNTGLIELYFSIGRRILEEQETVPYGSAVLARLAADLRKEFPQMKGFSRSNLFYMRAFAGAWQGEESVVQQAVGQLPWGHIVLLLDKLDDQSSRNRYAEAAAEHGWSRSLLLNHIMNKTIERTGAAASNFAKNLAEPDAALAQQIAKDPYFFDFLNLGAEAAERELEQGLSEKIVKTLQELGTGFAFVGRQVHFDVDCDDFYLDLLFFHVEQLRYVVVELKTGRFQPEFAGKLQFYIALVDNKLRRPVHHATVGILICGTRNERTVRYALGAAAAPMAVSTYTYEALPLAEQQKLPGDAELTTVLNSVDAA